MLCYNIEHNFSWTVDGKVKPCNWLDTLSGSPTIEEMQSSVEYQQLKADNNLGVKNRHCQKCWYKEALGQNSKRNTDNKVAQAYNKINPDFIKIDAAIGDRCNAACVICGPHSSTIWQKEMFGKVFRLEPKTYVWDAIRSNSKNILQLDFGGGEPWLNDVEQQIEVLQELVTQGVASKIKLRYNTNGSIYPKQLIECFRHFRQVEITLSIDDVGARFEYNRFPLKWNNVLENLSKLVDLEKNNNKIKLTINYTISVFTFLYLQEFEKHAQQLGIPNVSWSVLHQPSLYNIKSLPVDCKDSSLESNTFYALIASEPLTNWKTQFFKTIGELDARRGTDFKQTFPELYTLIK
jgi:organic radical activating enzyme